MGVSRRIKRKEQTDFTLWETFEIFKAEKLAYGISNGKQIGQPKGAKLTTKKSLAAKEVILKHSKDFNGSLSDDDCIKLAAISRNSFYKYKKELKETAE